MMAKKLRCFLFLLLVIGVTPVYPHGFPIMGGLSIFFIMFLIVTFGKIINLKYRVLYPELERMADPGEEETLKSKRTNRSSKMRVWVATVIEICLFAALYFFVFILRIPASFGEVFKNAILVSFISFSITMLLSITLFSNKDRKVNLVDLMHLSAALPVRFLIFIGVFWIIFSIISC